LTYLNYYQEIVLPFSLLFLPLIILVGYWEETIGALWLTVAAALSMVGFNLMKVVTPTNAMISVMCYGVVFALIALINYDREKKDRERQTELEPREMELAAVKHKAFITREQIERYEKRLKGLVKLYEVSKELGTELELQTMLDEARQIVARIMQHHFKVTDKEPARLAIYIPAEDTNGFLRTGSRGLEVSDEGFPEKITAFDLKQWLGEDFNSVRINDVVEEERYQSFARVDGEAWDTKIKECESN